MKTKFRKADLNKLGFKYIVGVFYYKELASDFGIYYYPKYIRMFTLGGLGVNIHLNITSLKDLKSFINYFKTLN